MFVCDKLNGAEAHLEAQKIAFGPVVFQTARLLRDFGILQLLHDTKEGLSLEEISEKTDIPLYGVRILCESGFSMMALKFENDKYFMTKVGRFLLLDEMTRVNMDFNQDVNYLGLFHLEQAIKNVEPSGLHKVFGSWDTIYPALSELPEKAKESWFKFDHFYSDNAFKKLVKIMANKAPKKLLDVGGNTGKWAVGLTTKSPTTEVTILDHPGQLKEAYKRAKENGVEDRVKGIAMDLLDHSIAFPKGFDAVWMSQFLDCFGPADVIAILRRAAEALNEDGLIYIIEPYWDRQSHDVGSYVLINTSPYFTALANGTSKMYSAADMHEFVKAAGLVVEEEKDNIGFGSSITVCKRG